MKVKSMLAGAALLVAVAANAQMPTPSPELKKLNWMVGEWTGSVKWTMEGMPESTGEMPFKTEMDGLFLKTIGVMDMGGMKMSETTYMWWDPVKKRYSSAAFTNFGSTPRMEHGTFENDKLVMTSEPWDVGMPEGPVVGRGTMTKKSDTQAHFMLEFKMGDKWTKVAEGTFTKKKS